MIGFQVNHNRYNVVVIGTGGTGGNLIPTLSRLFYSLLDGKENEILFTLVDGDNVDEGNLYRQPFIKSDLGKNKAFVFAKRYSNAFGIEISYNDTYIENEEDLLHLLTKCNKSYNLKGNYLPILIGCVDNNRSRAMMHNVFNKLADIVYIDSGNEKISGQVVMGVRSKGNVLMPPVAELYPSILEDKSSIFKSQESCSNVQRNEHGIDVKKMSQQLITNATASNIILNFLSNIILGKELVTNMVNFNTDHINCRPQYMDFSATLATCNGEY